VSPEHEIGPVLYQLSYMNFAECLLLFPFALPECRLLFPFALVFMTGLEPAPSGLLCCQEAATPISLL